MSERGLRSSEEFALALYRAWIRYEGETEMPADEIEWEDIGEWQQRGYLDQVNTVFDWLFEHGRISAYLNPEQLEEYHRQYCDYLEQKARAQT